MCYRLLVLLSTVPHPSHLTPTNQLVHKDEMAPYCSLINWKRDGNLLLPLWFLKCLSGLPAWGCFISLGKITSPPYVCVGFFIVNLIERPLIEVSITQLIAAVSVSILVGSR